MISGAPRPSLVGTHFNGNVSIQRHFPRIPQERRWKTGIVFKKSLPIDQCFDTHRKTWDLKAHAVPCKRLSLWSSFVTPLHKFLPPSPLPLTHTRVPSFHKVTRCLKKTSPGPKTNFKEEPTLTCTTWCLSPCPRQML